MSGLVISCCLEQIIADDVPVVPCQQENVIPAVFTKPQKPFSTSLRASGRLTAATLKLEDLLRPPEDFPDGGLEGGAGEVREAHTLEVLQVQDVPQPQSVQVFSLLPNANGLDVTKDRAAAEPEPKLEILALQKHGG